RGRAPVEPGRGGRGGRSSAGRRIRTSLRRLPAHLRHGDPPRPRRRPAARHQLLSRRPPARRRSRRSPGDRSRSLVLFPRQHAGRPGRSRTPASRRRSEGDRMTLDVTAVRRQFPALQSDTVFFDNPGGTQVPQAVLDRMLGYLTKSNANRDGAFATRREEIVFGPNRTSLTFQISRALAREFLPGDEIIVTRLDHDANIAPWRLVAEDRGCLVRWLDFGPEDCTLDLAMLG